MVSAYAQHFTLWPNTHAMLSCPAHTTIAPPFYYREDCAVRAMTLVSSMSALCHLDSDSVDKTVTELAAYLLLTYKTWRTAFKMASGLTESALASSHPLLKGLNSLVCCEGEGCECCEGEGCECCEDEGCVL